MDGIIVEGCVLDIASIITYLLFSVHTAHSIRYVDFNVAAWHYFWLLNLL